MDIAIKESTQHLRWSKKPSRIGFFDYNLEENIVFWDQEMYTICGLDHQSSLNKNEYFFSLIHPDDSEDVITKYNESFLNERNSYYYNAFRLIVNDKILYITSSALLLRQEDGTVSRVLGYISDKTSEIEIQEALIHSEEKLRSILDYTPDIIFTVDPDYKITYINRVAPGLSKEEVIGSNVIDLIAVEDRARVISILERIFAKKISEEEFFTTYRTPDFRDIRYYSKVTPIFNIDEIIGVTIISRDVTDQENIQAKLSESEYLFRMLFESSADKIFTIDKDWKINLINRPPKGLDKKDILGHSILELISPTDKKKVKDKLDILFNEKKAVEYNSIFEKSTDGIIHYSTRASPLIENGEVYGAVLASRDITHSVHQAEILEAQSRELLRTNQNLQQFAYVSSHDMKAPVANLKSLITIMESEKVITSEGQPIFDKLKQAVDQMNSTIVTLNEVFAVQSNLNLKREKVSIEGIFKSVTGSIENLLYESQVTINTEFQLPYLEFPAVHLNSILQNLITNSVKYRHPDRAPEITIKTYKEGGFSWLELKDNGRGIDLEKHGRKVFGLFQRFDLSTEGRGIGLHIIKNIVENYGGEVILKSQPEEGTTFIIQIS